MTPEFASAVDPIFLHLADLFDRISRNDSGTAEEVREGMDRCFVRADDQLKDQEDWQLAKYALVSWVDEELKRAPWDGNQWWTQNPLEFEYFRSNLAGEQFFVKAQEAASLNRRDALEVFYVCVILGFRGFYQLAGAPATAEKLHEPPEIESWVENTARRIKSKPGRPRFHDSVQPIRGAPPLLGKFWLISTMLAGVVLAGFLIVLGYFLYLA